ncbi:MAG: hypothetical protein U5J63_00715 [Fodinibius sp.]|nr:hypothetical protein [Fodinibius sp.]
MKIVNGMRYMFIALLSILFLDQCKITEPLTKADSYEPFAVSYEDIENLGQAANQYDLLIVEPDNYSKAEVDSLKTPDNTVLGYPVAGRSKQISVVLSADGGAGIFRDQ